MKTTNLILIIGGFLSATAPITRGAEVTLKPVSASGVHTLNGNEIILYGAGQTITLEVGTDHWGPSPLKTYQVQLDCAGYSSGTSGVLAPVVLSCPSANLAGNQFCQNAFGDVGPSASHCRDFDPGPATVLQCDPAWVNSSRTDWVFFGHDVAAAAVDLSTCNTRMGGALNPNSPVVYGGIEKYCGTIVLQVPAGAQGEFTIGFVPGQGITFLANENNDEITPLFLMPAIITIAPPPAYGACCDHSRPGGECTDNVAEPDCLAMGEESEFFKGQSCAEIEAAGLCEEHTGACCDHAAPAGDCGENIAESVCLAKSEEPEFFAGQTCDAIEAAGLCYEHTGACCDHAAPGGECKENIAESICLATGEQMEFFLDESCATIEAAGLCDEQTGACCIERLCTDNVARSACASKTWIRGIPCDDPDVAELCAEQPIPPIPTVSEWGLINLALLLLTGGKVYFGQRRFAV